MHQHCLQQIMPLLDRRFVDRIRQDMVGDEGPPQHRSCEDWDLVLLVQYLWWHIDRAQLPTDFPGQNIVGVVTDSSFDKNGCFLLILEELINILN